MKNTKLHPIAKNLGYSSNEDFYKDFDTKEKYDAYMQRGGQINVQQNQAMPIDRTVQNNFRNTTETRSDGYKRPNQIPFVMQQGPNVLKKTGGPGSPNNNYTNAGGIYSYQQGGIASNYTYNHMPQPPQNPAGYNQGEWNNEMGKTWRQQNLPQQTVDQEYAGFGNPMSDVNYKAPGDVSGFGAPQQGVPANTPRGMAATGFPTLEEAKAKARNRQNPIGPSAPESDYSMAAVRSGNPAPQQNLRDNSNYGCEADLNNYKSGGIHIKPENRGKFTEYKKRTGKTTEEALHSKDPHVRQMANFARNAAKWHHQDGGPVNPQQYMYNPGGNYQVGGLYHNQTNPNYGTFTPEGIRVAQMGWNGAPIPTANNLRGQEYGCPQDLNYQVGGLYANQTQPNYGTYTPFGIRVAQQGDNNTAQPGNVPGSGPGGMDNSFDQDNTSSQPILNQPGNRPGSGPGQMDTDMDPNDQSDFEKQNLQDMSNDMSNSRSSSKPRSNWPAYVGAGIGAVTGALAGIGAVAGRNQKARNQAGARMNQGMTSSKYPHSNPLGSKGDQGIVGQGYGQNLSHFGAGNVGAFYQPIAQQGMMVTPYQNGGMYQAGSEHELPDHEIQRLQKLGYKLQIL